MLCAVCGSITSFSSWEHDMSISCWKRLAHPATLLLGMFLVVFALACGVTDPAQTAQCGPLNLSGVTADYSYAAMAGKKAGWSEDIGAIVLGPEPTGEPFGSLTLLVAPPSGTDPGCVAEVRYATMSYVPKRVPTGPGPAGNFYELIAGGCAGAVGTNWVGYTNYGTYAVKGEGCVKMVQIISPVDAAPYYGEVLDIKFKFTALRN
jgi:hypothetical protein